MYLHISNVGKGQIIHQNTLFRPSYKDAKVRRTLIQLLQGQILSNGS